MNANGLNLCLRYAFPPNSLSLCGPERNKDLQYYSENTSIDQGTEDLLSQFSTLYPYLSFIAYENNFRDPFHPEVVEAYWLGNYYLTNISMTNFSRYLKDTLCLKKSLSFKIFNNLLEKIPKGAIPSHAFHVLNVYIRTGNVNNPHTINTMDSCMIKWGFIRKILHNSLIIETEPLEVKNYKIVLGPPVLRNILCFNNDITKYKLKEGDFISFHWGQFCEKINRKKLINLRFYTNLSIKLANQKT